MVKFIETKNRMVVAGPCVGEEIEKLLFSGYSLSVWEDKNVLGLNTGDSSRTVWMYLPLNCTLNMVKMVHFRLCILFLYLFIFGCAGSSLLRGLFPGCGAQPSRCGGFSVAEHRL